MHITLRFAHHVVKLLVTKKIVPKYKQIIFFIKIKYTMIMRVIIIPKYYDFAGFL